MPTLVDKIAAQQKILESLNKDIQADDYEREINKFSTLIDSLNDLTILNGDEANSGAVTINAQKGEIFFGGNNNTLDTNNKYNFEFYNSYITTDSFISLTPFFIGDMNTTVALSVMIGSQSAGFCQIGVRNSNSTAIDMSQVKIKFCIL